MEFIVAGVYVILGLLGGAGHYLKKRYVDDTTKQGFIEYLKGDFTSTKKAIFTIVTSEVALSAAAEGVFPGFGAVIGAITAGYAADSVVNSASDSPKLD